MGSSLSTTKSTSPALSTDLTPCDPKEALRLLGPLFRNLASDRKWPEVRGNPGDPPYERAMRRQQEEKQEAMAVYVRPLTKEPAWAIEQAVARFLDGLVDRHKSRVGWVPKSDEFAQEVRRLSDWARQREEHAARMRRIAAENAAAIEEAKTARTPTGEEAKAALERFFRSSRMIKEEETHRG